MTPGTACMDDLVARLEPVLRDEILKEFPAQSCIASSCILAMLLREEGLEAWPVAVEVVVVNAAYLARVREEGQPADVAMFDRWVQDHGAARVEIGRGIWPGHMALFTTGGDGSALWDASLDQVNGLLGAVVLPKLLVFTHLSPAFRDAGETFDARLPDGTTLSYKAKAAQLTGARRAEDWMEDARKIPAVVARVRARLDAHTQEG